MRDIVSRLKELGGLHEEEDFAAQRSNWVEPIHASYRGYDVYECPPTNQGLTALMILRTLEGYALGGDAFSEADRLHLIAEATKAAYYVRDNFIGDPDFVDGRCRGVPVRGMRRARRAARSGSTARCRRSTGTDIEHKDTIYMCVVDRDGNACSFINSLFSAFGTGIMAPESGVILHNRGSGFRTIPGHPSAIAPRKRPFHTLIPGMLVKDGRAVMPFGVMGGQYQAVGHATFLHHLLDRGMDPQQAAEAPRVFAYQGVLQIEHFVPEPVRADLAQARPQDRDAGGADRRLPGDLDRPRARRPDRRLRTAQGRAGARVLSAERPSTLSARGRGLPKLRAPGSGRGRGRCAQFRRAEIGFATARRRLDASLPARSAAGAVSGAADRRCRHRGARHDLGRTRRRRPAR